MWHRHVDDPENRTIAGIEDVIIRGDIDSKRQLARRIADNPNGDISLFLERVVESGNDELGTYAVVWRRFLDRARKRTLHTFGKV